MRVYLQRQAINIDSPPLSLFTVKLSSANTKCTQYLVHHDVTPDYAFSTSSKRDANLKALQTARSTELQNYRRSFQNLFQFPNNGINPIGSYRTGTSSAGSPALKNAAFRGVHCVWMWGMSTVRDMKVISSGISCFGCLIYLYNYVFFLYNIASNWLFRRLQLPFTFTDYLRFDSCRSPTSPTSSTPFALRNVLDSAVLCKDKRFIKYFKCNIPTQTITHEFLTHIYMYKFTKALVREDILLTVWLVSQLSWM